MRTRYTKLIPIMFLSLTLFMGVREVEAVSFSINSIPDLCYYWNKEAPTNTGWSGGLVDAIGTVSYNAQVINVDTGSILNDGSIISVGTHIKFEAIPHQDSDISWFGSGGSNDSPYGVWRANASAPPTAEPYYLGVATWGLMGNSAFNQNIPMPLYIPLSVNPPLISYDHTGSTAGLSCDTSGQNCTITSVGSITGRVNFGSTYGKFYYAYYYAAYGVVYNQYAMRTGTFDINSWNLCTPSSSEYSLPVPAQTITFSLTAVSNNNPPTPPTITGVSSANLGSTNTFTFNATDPDGDTIKYEIDWNNDGTVDGLSPTSGFVSSGSNSTSNYTLPSTGTSFTFKARTVDVNGGISGWTTKTVTLLQAINGSCGAADGTILPSIPTIGLCIDPGVASSITTNATNWTWTCSGTNGGNASPVCTTTKQGPTVNLWFSWLDRLKLFTSNLLSNSTLIDRVLAYDTMK